MPRARKGSTRDVSPPSPWSKVRPRHVADAELEAAPGSARHSKAASSRPGSGSQRPRALDKATAPPEEDIQELFDVLHGIDTASLLESRSRTFPPEAFKR